MAAMAAAIRLDYRLQGVGGLPAVINAGRYMSSGLSYM